ncbi:hypothetical protein [Methylobacterium sp. Leaf118]|uniref:hypothetical protein n=1 Tax=Methylobacterium sp. Leaf118 TaxID=2876562 RepID=UPI001E542A90|nr:hypothetical protein [Methylobacterium sp. Leaf118]
MREERPGHTQGRLNRPERGHRDRDTAGGCLLEEITPRQLHSKHSLDELGRTLSMADDILIEVIKFSDPKKR